MTRLDNQLGSCFYSEVLTEEAQFDSIRGEWDELLDDSEQCVFFLRWAWNRLWWNTYAPPGGRLFLIACRDGNGTLVGLAPFYWRQRKTVIPHLREVLFIGTGIEIKTSEYLDIISRRGFERQVAEMIAGVLRKRDDWDRLWLWGIPAASAALPCLSDALGARTHVKVCDRYPHVDTRSDWQTVKTGFGHHLRIHIDRLVRQLFRRHSCKFRRIERLDDLEPALDDFVRLHQARWQAKGKRGSFALFNFESFMRHAMRSGLEDGRLRFWVLNLDGRCAATVVAFVDHGVAHYFQSGFDPYASPGLGKVMLALCIQDCIEAKEIVEFDFMGGGAAYKDTWTKTVRDGIELELLRPGVRAQVYIAGRRARQTLRGVYHALVPESQRGRIRDHLRDLRVHFRTDS